MNEKELRKLSRRDLLEMLIEQSEELLETKKQLQELEKKLAEREINIDKAGSIAEAALSLSGIFELAEVAGQEYLENIKKLSERQETVSARLEHRSMEIAKQRILEANAKCQAAEEASKAKCAEMVANAEAEAKKYWDEVSVKMEKFYDEHVGLRELLAKSPFDMKMYK